MRLLTRKRRLIPCFALIAVMVLNGCGALLTDQFSEATGPPPANGYLLRGSGWTDWKYGYALNDVNQAETKDLIAAVQIKNHRQITWAVGPIIPVIPFFGLFQEGYNGSVLNEKGVKVTIALFNKSNKSLHLDPCKTTLVRDQLRLNPTTFSVSFLDQENTTACSSGLTADVDVIGRANDIVLLNLYFPKTLYPASGTKINLPPIELDAEIFHLQEFSFDKGTSLWWVGII